MAQHTLTREQAINAYRRTKDLADRMQARINAEILIPEFGQNLCRLHNCVINWESGHVEAGRTINGVFVPNPAEHYRQVKLAKLYNYRQARIWELSDRLSTHFSRYF